MRLLMSGLEADLWPREPLIDRVIDALCAAGEPGVAEAVMTELGNRGAWQPTAVHHNSLLMAMVRRWCTTPTPPWSWPWYTACAPI